MALEHNEIVKLIDSGVSPKIKLARTQAKKINMHITGRKVASFLEKLDDYENDAQKALRTKLIKSNRSLFSFILRPADKIFTAKGGSINYNLPQQAIDTLKESISSIADGIDIKKYLKKVVKQHYFIDPNAILFIDIDKYGKLETHVITTDKILWYENKGNSVKAIIFEGYKKDEDNKKIDEKDTTELQAHSRNDKIYYRVLDEVSDRIYIKEGSEIYEDTSSRLSNYFKFVPATILGDEKNPNEDIFDSFIGDIVEDADRMLRLVSTTNIHDLSHLYPRYWSYEQACVRCGGEGQVVKDEEADPPVYSTCTSCGGDGVKRRTNPSDETIIPIPQDGEPVITPHINGFSSPDLQTAKFYYELIESSKEGMFKSIWGTSHEHSGKRETATGRWLDKQPVQDRLRDMSDTFARYHKFMLDCYIKVLRRDVGYQSSVSYGNRYILETPYELLDKYKEASREKVSEVVQLDLRDRYLEAEYQTDSLELVKRKKLSKIEPFPTMRPSEVTGLNLPDQEVLKKLYFSTWASTLSDAEILLKKESQLIKSLDDYVNTKTLKTKTNEIE